MRRSEVLDREGPFRNSGKGLPASICCCGWFDYVPLFDVVLTEQSRISARCKENLRVVGVPLHDPDRRIVAVGGGVAPFSVTVYDLDNSVVMSRFSRLHEQEVRGLASISSSSCLSAPRIVSGGRGDRKVFVLDPLSGSRVCSLELPVQLVQQIISVPEWNGEIVTAGGYRLNLVRYTCGQGDSFPRVGECRVDDQPSRHLARGLCASPSLNLIITATDDRRIRMYGRDDLCCATTVRTRGRGLCCCFAPNRRLVLVGMDEGGIELWDARQTSAVVGRFEMRPFVLDIEQLDEDRFVLGLGFG